MFKFPWGWCFNSGHEDLEADLNRATLNHRLTIAQLRECREGAECEVRLTACHLKVAELMAGASPDPSPPTYQQAVSGAEVKSLMRSVVGNSCQIIMADVDYKITTVAEFKRFLREARIYLMQWRAEAPDCDDFTRRAKGDLVCPGWWWQPAFDVWHKIDDPVYTSHSQFCTLLLDNEVDRNAAVYVVEIQALDLFEMAEEFFEDNPAFMLKQ